MGLLQTALFLVLSQAVTLDRIPAGTSLQARLESSVQTATSDVGDPVIAVVTEPLRNAGTVIIPQGSRLVGRVETIEPADRSTAGRVRLAFREIQFPDGRNTSTWITESFTAPTPNRTRRYILFVGIGAAGGGLIGGKGARTAGILGGTIVGFAIAANSGDGKRPDITLQPGRVLHLRLGQDLQF